MDTRVSSTGFSPRWSVSRSARQALARQSTGNRCGHKPGFPAFYEIPGRRPVILTQFADEAERFYDSPDAIRALNEANGSTRQMRSEAREAVIRVLQLLASHLDLISMQVIRAPQDRQGLDTLWMSKRLNMSEIRVYRAVRYLKRAGMLTVTPWVERRESGEFRARAAIRVLHPLCFAVLGLAVQMQKARQRALKEHKRAERRASKEAQREEQLAMPIDDVQLAQMRLLSLAKGRQALFDRESAAAKTAFMRFYEKMRRERPALSAADIIQLFKPPG